MQDFVELKGASGRGYRFRLVRTGETPLPIAGNYAMVTWQAGRPTVVRLDMTNDLSKVREAPPPSGRGSFHHYIRLNVSRATREAEHEDLAPLHQPRERIAAE
jgi:hypothetical protein